MFRLQMKVHKLFGLKLGITALAACHQTLDLLTIMSSKAAAKSSTSKRAMAFTRPLHSLRRLLPADAVLPEGSSSVPRPDKKTGSESEHAALLEALRLATLAVAELLVPDAARLLSGTNLKCVSV